ncbi:UNVERIFIED_CONTAM: hypothetical protein FKN15_041663 [Acipenser sinensis]
MHTCQQSLYGRDSPDFLANVHFYTSRVDFDFYTSRVDFDFYTSRVDFDFYTSRVPQAVKQALQSVCLHPATSLLLPQHTARQAEAGRRFSFEMFD